MKYYRCCMKKDIINSIRYSLGFIILYSLFELVDWKEALSLIDLRFILRMIITLILVIFLNYFIVVCFRRMNQKKELKVENK